MDRLRAVIHIERSEGGEEQFRTQGICHEARNNVMGPLLESKFMSDEWTSINCCTGENETPVQLYNCS